MDRLFTKVGDVVLRRYVNANEYFATSLISYCCNGSQTPPFPMHGVFAKRLVIHSLSNVVTVNIHGTPLSKLTNRLDPPCPPGGAGDHW